MQRRIGLTGGIASGKSSVGRLLEARGWPVLDADHYARDALARTRLHPKPWLSVSAQRSAAHRSRPQSPRPDRVQQFPRTPLVEDLIHPVVRDRFDQELDALQGEPVVVLMIPLLFEAGLESLCSEVWLVDCEPEQQLERLMQRDGLNEAKPKPGCWRNGRCPQARSGGRCDRQRWRPQRAGSSGQPLRPARSRNHLVITHL